MKKVLLICGLICHFIAFGQKPELVLPIGHTSFITDANFSPDGKKVVTSSDSIAKIWDAQSGRFLANLIDHSAMINTAQFSPDGKKIVTASSNAVKIWEAETGKLLKNLIGHSLNVISANFSPDGEKIVTASSDSTVKIWDTQTGKLLSNLVGHSRKMISATFSPDGKKIITASWDRTPKVWDVETGKLLLTLAGHSKTMTFANFSPDSKKIATASWDSTTKIWDAQTGKLLLNLIGHPWKVNCANFSPDGKKIITVSWNSAYVWDIETAKLLANLEGHTNNIASANFSPDGKKILTASWDNTSKLWDAQTGGLLNDLVGHSWRVTSANFSLDGKKIITASDDHSIKIWETETGKLLIGLSGHSTGVSYAKFSPDGKKIATAYDNNTARIWDVKTGKLLIYFPSSSWSYQINFSPDSKKIVNTSKDFTATIWDTETGKILTDLSVSNVRIYSAKFSPDGKLIVAVCHDRTAKLWDVQTGKLLTILSGHNQNVAYAEFSPDGKRVVTASEDSTTKIWDVLTGKLMRDLKGHSSEVFSASFNPKGNKVVSTSWEDDIVKIWDVENGKLLVEIDSTPYAHWSTVFSPDGKKIITSSFDKIAKIWDTETGKFLTELQGNSNINTLYFSRDGKKIITASRDKTIKVYDSETGLLLTNLKGHSSYAWDANFSPDGKKIVSASNDNTAKIWNAETGELSYTFLAIDSLDYLVYDNDFRYDGTIDARNLLYFKCGNEIVDLDQIKDLCWEPGLVEKIMGTNTEPIKAKRLDEISICGNSPIIENIEDNKDQKKFKIKRRGGGIGELAIYINQKEVEKIAVSSLVFTNDEAIVSIDAEKYKNYFEDGKENSIQLQARTADLSISSKGAVMQVKMNSKPTTAPNLYAIIAGVSDYKGDKLDLRFAAKDAEDFSNALQESARALLNIDGKEHVFITTLVSNSPNSPSKSNISKAFADIKNKAKANDIVVVYLSGHGENFGTESTNFYYLTEDASSFELSGIEKEVAISTNEFAEWLKAIAAGKQVLILDACASGKLAEDMLIAMRAGISSDQIRALDRLNSRTGTFILSGAAANQSAYETSIYGQGLLTYSLLYGMKSGTALKDNQFVDVDKLFQYCADKVKELAAGIGGIQDPVISKPNGGASFDIGKIDETVASKIVLALPKPIFTNSKFYNKETDDDNLGLEKAIDNLLNEYASKGKESKLIFTEKSQLPESYKLVGSYQLNNNVAEITIRLKKGSTEIQKFEVKGDTQKTDKLALEIIEKANQYLMH